METVFMVKEGPLEVVHVPALDGLTIYDSGIKEMVFVSMEDVSSLCAVLQEALAFANNGVARRRVEHGNDNNVAN